MSKSLQSVKGMNDILPDETALWLYLEDTIRGVFESYGYRQIRMPILEQTSLFKRSIGEATDIVEKEMYTFEDRGGDSLTLRPEGTAGTVRAGMQHGLFHNQIQRLWYIGPMFRRERPQKGRYRQFFQVGVETFGMSGPDIDAELILMTARLWKALGLEGLRLELNTLGTAETRTRYREDLINYFSASQDQLDEDSQRRLHKNPLRILDSKNPKMADLIKGAPTFQQYLDTESADHFQKLRDILDQAGLKYEVNSRLVRGLDYYSKTVFEWITDQLGAQGTVCGGGRFDGLIEHFGGKETPAIGFAMGLDRLVELLKDNGQKVTSPSDVYLITVGEQAIQRGLVLAEKLRDQIPELKLLSNCGGGSYKAQFKRADKSGARYAIILGDDEITNGTVSIKDLHEGNQKTIDQKNIAKFLVD
ncbi:MAG: histidine--tRNA ligase [Gammaproteobacteria bacterium]